MARPSFPGWLTVRRALGLVPRDAGHEIADALAVEQFERIRERLPALYAVLALVGIAAMVLTPARIDPYTRFGLPLVMTVASRLWAEAIEAYWRNQGGSLGSTLAGWEPFFAWRPVCVDSQWHWLSVLERRRASVRPAGGTWVYRRIGM